MITRERFRPPSLEPPQHITRLIVGTRNWDRANRISDEIVALLNRQIEEMRRAHDIDSLQLLAGLLMGFKAVQESMPSNWNGYPDQLVNLFYLTDSTLEEILRL